MGKSLRTVAVIDSESTASGIAEAFEKSGHEPDLTFASDEDDLRRLSRDTCDIVVACHPHPTLAPQRVVELLRDRPNAPPVVVYGESYTDDEIVSLVQAGALDCLRSGDGRRFAAALERARAPRARPAPAPAPSAAAEAELEDHHRALIEEIPALTYVC
jgi:DNA-binding response OmpR family regulator